MEAFGKRLKRLPNDAGTALPARHRLRASATITKLPFIKIPASRNKKCRSGFSRDVFEFRG
jgi:hypothetical protein